MPVLLPALLPSPTPLTTGAFPDEDLELTAEAAWGADLDADPGTWAWTDLSDRVIDTPVTATRGVLVGGRTSRGTSGTIALLNDDGALSLHHPASPWWPHVDAGTPIRVSVRTRTAPILADTFTRTLTDSWGSPDIGDGSPWLPSVPADFDVTGTTGTITFPVTNVLRRVRVSIDHRDVDMVADFSIPAVASGVACGIGHYLRADNNNTSYLWAALDFGVDGTVGLRLRHVITDIATATQPGLTYTAGTKIRLRTLVVGDRVRMRAWLAAGVEPSGWPIDHTLTVVTGAGTHIGILAWMLSTSTNTLPFTMTVDDLTVQQPRYPRLEGYIADIRPSYVPVGDGTTHSIAVVDVGGVGTTLELRTADAWSPMRRSIQQATNPPWAYWPCEDADRSTSAASGIVGQPPLIANGPVTFSFDTGVPAEALLTSYGSKNLCSLAAGGRLAGTFTPASVQNEWTMSVTTNVTASAVPVAEIRVMEWATGGTFDRWALISTSTGHSVRAYNDTAGTSTTVCSSVEGVNVLVGYDITAVQNGPNIDVQLLLDATVYASGSVAGTLGAPQSVSLNPDRANVTGSTNPFGQQFLVGHVIVSTSAAAASLPYYYDDDLTLYRADQGWYREPTHLRAARIAREGRVAFRLAAQPDEATRLNSQQEGTTPDLIAAAVEAESGGLLYEANHGYELLPRTARYNRPVDLTIDLAVYRRTGDTGPAEVLQPQLDLRAPTIWTVERTGGSQATWAASEPYRKRRGNLSDRKTLDLLEDGDLPGHAQWRVHLTEDAQGANYPAAVIDLTANPGLIDAWLLIRPGSRVHRTNQPTIAGLSTIDQVVEGITETIGRRTWTAAIEGAPAGVWDVGLYDDDTWLADSASTTLVADQPATSVGASESWQITTANAGDVWEQIDVGYVWALNGEEVTVTAMGAVTGSGPWLQTATVTRGTNGIVKPHSAGDQVQLASPAIYSL